jgi:hypothetical protein
LTDFALFSTDFLSSLSLEPFASVAAFNKKKPKATIKMSVNFIFQSKLFNNVFWIKNEFLTKEIHLNENA